jgi:hypothetical protein
MVSINATAEGWNGPAQAALFSRHPAMKQWVDLNFQFYKINISNIWLLDGYGGALDVDVEDYFKASP